MLDLVWVIMCINIMVIGVIMVYCGEVDSLICGIFGEYCWYLNYVE